MADPVRVTQAELEAALRRYLTKVAARYVPVLAGLLAIALIIAFVPTSEPKTTSALGFGASGGQGGFGTVPGSGSQGTASPAGSGQGAVGSLGTAGSGTGAAGGASVGGASSATFGATGTSSSPSSSTPAGITPAAAPGSSGVTVTGVHCGPGVRQFSWSKYAPTCVPAWHGNNGGATAPGVTATTITLSYRLPNSAQQSAVNALAGAANVNDAAYLADLEAYIKFFNTQFELYGRHVVLKTFQGQGDYLAEDQGQDLAGAQADAVTAHDLGAFGDVTFPLYSSQYYMQFLAEEHVIAFGAVYLPNAWFDQYAPYEYSVFSPTGDNAAQAAVDVICRRMAHLPAIFTNDPIISHETRRFGLIIPENAVYKHAGDIIAKGLEACGAPLAATVYYTINVAEFESQAVEAVAEMKAAGVTSVICACDPLIPIFISQAADQQHYYPEWLDQYWGDPDTRNFAQDQWDHAVSATGYQAPVTTETEAYKTYELAYPGQHPAEWEPASPPYFYVAYYTLLQIFDALQAAGPDLTPQTFEQGMFSLPPSLPGGDAFAWRFGRGVFDPIADYTIERWNTNARSNFDGGKGAWLACDGGKRYDFDDPAALGPPGRQLDCPPGT